MRCRDSAINDYDTVDFCSGGVTPNDGNKVNLISISKYIYVHYFFSLLLLLLSYLSRFVCVIVGVESLQFFVIGPNCRIICPLSGDERSKKKII